MPPSFLLSPTRTVSSISLLLSTNLLLLVCCLSPLDQQGRALLTWKQTLEFSADVLNSWNPSDATPCGWYGITCNAEGEVTDIYLRSVDLRGSLPSNLQSLKSLSSLVISSTNISGPIPKELGDYQELEHIDLSNNLISGEIPKELCKLRKLKTVYFNSNSLQGAIPPQIGYLSNLSHLILYDNDLSGEIPASIGQIQSLQVFRAGGNQNIRGPIPSEIGNCSNLVMLGLAETGVSGRIPSSFGLLKQIQTIAVYTALLSGPVPEELGNCTELRNLYLYQNSLSGPIPPQLGGLPKLESLLLWQNSLVGSIPPELGSCAKVVVLDLSVNLLSGNIPASFGNLSKLQELHLSSNQLSGPIPSELSHCNSLTDLELDNNQLSGEVRIDFKKMENLTLFFAWQNNLTGGIPENLAECRNLQSLDLSYNGLTGPIPKEIFGLRNLTKLLLLSNELSGFIPPDIGNCTNLSRFRANSNRLSGTIPAQIGDLKVLNFLDLSNNKLAGPVPEAVSGCDSLAFLDLHSNALAGTLPETLPKRLQFIDVSSNQLTGPLVLTNIGSLSELTKLILAKNRLSGAIPSELSTCLKLQLLDLGDNGFSGAIPPELGRLPSLEISLNLSYNQLTGGIPVEFSGLKKLGCLDLSHNQLTGSLDVLAELENLVTLNISSNAFSGELPDTPFFRQLQLSDFGGNHGLYINRGYPIGLGPVRRTAMSAMKLAITLLISIMSVLLLLALYVLIRTRGRRDENFQDDDEWEITLYQKLDISMKDVVHSLTSANVIGTGSSGVVYRVTLTSGDTIAVKKMWLPEDTSAMFRNEISALATIRHRNIVRLLGWGSNKTTKLLFYSYHANGSLRSFLDGGGKVALEWERRYGIALGLAHAIAYLHHDCVPPILHGDVKAMNVLLGPMFEPYLADFGLARTVGTSDGDPFSCKLDMRRASPQRIAGSYGYMAPELASMQMVTEKCDVYSYGVVLIEMLTGKHPLDPSLPDGAHLVQWVVNHLQAKKEPGDLLDPRLRREHGAHMQEEMVQVLAVSVLCVSARPSDRPSMKDAVALLREIQVPPADVPKGPVGLGDVVVSLGPPVKDFFVFQGSSSCSFALSRSSV